MPQSVISEHITINPEPLAKRGISGQIKEKQNYDKSIIHLPRQCLRNVGKSLDFIGFLGWKRRIYTLFTPLEDRIGNQDIWKLQGICFEY